LPENFSLTTALTQTLSSGERGRVRADVTTKVHKRVAGGGWQVTGNRVSCRTPHKTCLLPLHSLRETLPVQRLDKIKTLSGADWTLRLAREPDIPVLKILIPLSVRTLQATHYSTAQLEAGVGRSILIACEAALQKADFQSAELVATLRGEPFYASFDYAVIERYEVSMANGVALPVVRMAKRFNSA
jgi:hypothetical protein